MPANTNPVRSVHGTLGHLFVVLLLLAPAGGAFAADVFKCIGRDKAVRYQATPCGEAATRPAGVNGIPDTSRFSNRQVNLAYECMEAFDLIVEREARGDEPMVQDDFNRYCGAMGFIVPDSATNREANGVYRRSLRGDLDNNNHTGPTFTRTYSGGVREPPLFSGF